MSDELGELPEPQTVEVPLVMKIEIYWPNPPTTEVGIVYLNGYCAHSLSFHRVMPEDTTIQYVSGWWRMGERYFLNDDSLVEAIKKEAADGLMSGKIRMHYADRK